MATIERGIAPAQLIAQLANTVPWLFGPEAPPTPYSSTVRSASPERQLSHLEYFQLCLCAHYTSVASFVPTDVDNQIRKKLWHAKLPLESSEAMAELTLRSLSWDFRPYTARAQEFQGDYVCGHHGEWLSVAVGAYAAHHRLKPGLARLVADRILEELRNEARIFSGLRAARDGLGLLRAASAIAHNLGDLDRVMDQWELPPDDFLRRLTYRLGHEPRPAFGPEQKGLLEAGALNKAFMASENHRHYPLRRPRCLRRARELLLPLGPFFDDWGARVGASALLSGKEKAEVADALLQGFGQLSSEKLPAFGYARALRGLALSFRELPSLLSARDAKALQRGRIAEINHAEKQEFESSWAKRALGLLASR